MFCVKCGAEIKDGDIFCRKCGTPVPTGRFQDEDSNVVPPLEEMPGEQAEDFPSEKRPKQKKSKIWIPIVIAVVILGLVAAGVFYVLPMMKEKKNSVSNKPEAQEEIAKDEPATIPLDTQAQSDDSNGQGDSSAGGQVAETPEIQQRILIGLAAGGHQLVLENWSESGWEQVFSCAAKVSKNGITPVKTEGDGKTPGGTYNVLFAVGTSKPSTNLDFVNVSSGSVWVDDSSSYYYNTLQKSNAAGKDWKSAEDFYSYFSSGTYNNAIFFDYNGDGRSGGTAVPGQGSVIFLFGRYDFAGGSPDSGDIYISASDMTKLLSYLDSSKNPTITIE